MSDEDFGPWLDDAMLLKVGMQIQGDFEEEDGGMIYAHEARITDEDEASFDMCPDLPLEGEWTIVRFRIRRPKALRDLITLVETLPAPSKHEGERV